MTDTEKLILRNQVLIMKALAEITFRTAGIDQSVCDGLWRSAMHTGNTVDKVDQAQRRFKKTDEQM